MKGRLSIVFAIVALSAFGCSASKSIDLGDYKKLYSDGLDCRIGDYAIIGTEEGASLLSLGEGGSARLLGTYPDKDFSVSSFELVRIGDGVERVLELLGCPRFQLDYGRSLEFGEQGGKVYRVLFDERCAVSALEEDDLGWYWGHEDPNNPPLSVEEALSLPPMMSLETTFRLLGAPRVVFGSSGQRMEYPLQCGGRLLCLVEMPLYPEEAPDYSVLVKTGSFCPQEEGRTQDHFSIEGASFTDLGDSLRVAALGKEESVSPVVFSLDAFGSIGIGMDLFEVIAELGMPNFGGSAPRCINYCLDDGVYTVYIGEDMAVTGTSTSSQFDPNEYAYDFKGREEVSLVDLLSVDNLTMAFRILGKPRWSGLTYPCYQIEGGAIAYLSYTLADEDDPYPRVILAGNDFLVW